MSIQIGYDEGGNYYVDYFSWQDEVNSIEIEQQIEGQEIEENYYINSLPKESYEEEYLYEIEDQLNAELEGWA